MKIYKHLQICYEFDQKNPKLDFLSYHENTAACRKITETMKNWAFNGTNINNHFNKTLLEWYELSSEEQDALRKQFYKEKQASKDSFKPNVFDNIPLKGFCLLSVQSRWSTDNKVFRVKDPRGFIVEIYANNLIELMLTSHIERGVITDECIWMRDGAKNWLINVNSDVYKDYMHQISERKKKTSNTISIKEVNPGDVVKIFKHNEEQEYVYLGHYHIELLFIAYTYSSHFIRDKTKQKLKIKEYPKNKTHLFVQRSTSIPDYAFLYSVQTPKNITKIVKTNNKEEAELYIKDINDAYDMYLNDIDIDEKRIRYHSSLNNRPKVKILEKNNVG